MKTGYYVVVNPFPEMSQEEFNQKCLDGTITVEIKEGTLFHDKDKDILFEFRGGEWHPTELISSADTRKYDKAMEIFKNEHN